MYSMQKKWCGIDFVSWLGIATLLLVVSFGISACSTPEDPNKKPEPRTTPKVNVRASGPDKVLDPEKRGPYAVGVTTLTLEDKSRKQPNSSKHRPMVIEIWYPATDDTDKKAVDAYDMGKDAPPDVLKILKEKKVTLPKLTQVAARDAKPLRKEGPYPLILFSHGSGGIRFQSTFYCPHLASHGFVVISVDHDGNTLFDLLRDKEAQGAKGMGRSINDRPKDMKFMYDEMVKRNKDPKDRFFEMILPEQLGVTGHSFGGLTSVLIVRDFPQLKVSVPQAPHTTVARAVVNADDLAKVPFLVMASMDDKTLDYQDEQKSFYDLMITSTYLKSDRFFFALKRGGHFTYSDICELDLSAAAAKLGFGSSISNILQDGCHKDKNIPTKEGHRLINRYATAMFNVYLRGSKGSLKYLVPSAEKELIFDKKLP